MKVAFISTLGHVSWGGSEALWYETAKKALTEKHEVLTITHFFNDIPDKIKELARLGAATHFMKGYDPAITVRILRRLKNTIVKESEAEKLLKAFDPDVIVFNQCGAYEITEMANFQRYLLSVNKPYYIICHNYNETLVLTEEKRRILLNLFSKAKNVFMICQLQLDTIMKQIVKRLPNVSLIDNPVNLQDVGPIKFPALDKVHFACVASFDVDRKGQDIIFEVLSKEKWQNRNWQLNIYGGGKDKKYLEQLVSYFGIADKVIFKGHVQNINAIWRENHLLLLSSRIETGPMVLTEAMLCGRPVVTTYVGRVPEVVKDGYNGFIAGAATANLFDEALERAWQNKNQWESIGMQAYQTALNAVNLNAPETFLKVLLQAHLSSNNVVKI
ncbi:glycosyltransferase family 4 protein [Adhaeribacter rhizoryzae]|uniref:Glycosyltransferase family 4 protein n=1 Tax=Adhaeribacter rhizoryzae TaxID=2607907 RepID=A0A5M6DPZ7_9BACT|nr:glycosyltransferase family 4 protein [Adhaeribacter rhizoryzae]KAA5548322.1 glycosyltransferase family 4 protein [Adhaeribacter rhizoryzae]